MVEVVVAQVVAAVQAVLASHVRFVAGHAVLV